MAKSFHSTTGNQYGCDDEYRLFLICPNPRFINLLWHDATKENNSFLWQLNGGLIIIFFLFMAFDSRQPLSVVMWQLSRLSFYACLGLCSKRDALVSRQFGLVLGKRRLARSFFKQIGLSKPPLAVPDIETRWHSQRQFCSDTQLELCLMTPEI